MVYFFSAVCNKLYVTKNRCMTYVKIRGYANFVSSLLAYLISAVASWWYILHVRMPYMHPGICVHLVLCVR